MMSYAATVYSQADTLADPNGRGCMIFYAQNANK